MADPVDVRVVSGDMQETVAIDDDHLSSHFSPDWSSPVESWADIQIARAIEKPVGTVPIGERVSAASRVAIVVDDATRQTPTKRILGVLLGIIEAANVAPENVTITIGTGLHRGTTSEERRRILGQDVLNRFDVQDNNAGDSEQHSFIGTVEGGLSVYVNRRIVEADLVITIGMVKSHAFAGFTGGAKSIVPGVSDKRTIYANHGFYNLEYPRGLLGSCEKSASRRQMESAAKLIDPFIINVVVNGEGEIQYAAAGDVIGAHRDAVAFFRAAADRIAPELVDIALVFGGHSGTISLYHALFGCNAVRATEAPILKDNGTVILFAACREGVGTSMFSEFYSRFSGSEEILAYLATSHVVEGQWAVQFLATFLRDVKVSIVSEGLGLEELSLFGIDHFESVKAALGAAIGRYGPDYRLAVIENPELLLVNRRV